MIGPDLAVLDYVPPQFVGRAWSFALGVVGLGLGFGGVVVAILLRARAFAAMQRHEHEFLVARSERTLRVGPGRVVHGVVETEDDADVAVSVEITQLVVDHTSKNTHWHTWDEQSRAVRAAPFYLMQDDGVAVYVQPADDVLVVDLLDTVYPQTSPRLRQRTAVVKRGERFHAYGDLHRGHHPRAGGAYRSGGEGMILKPPADGRMLLATDAIEDRYKSRIAFLRGWGEALAIVWLGLNALLNGPFLAATFFGKPELARVASHRFHDTKNKGKTTRHYVLGVQCDDGFRHDAEVPAATYQAVTSSEISAAKSLSTHPDAQPSSESTLRVPILRVGDSTWASYLGYQASEPGWGIAVGFSAAVAMILCVALGYRTRPAWYDRKRLVERGGSQHWFEPRPHKPVEPAVD